MRFYSISISYNISVLVKSLSSKLFSFYLSIYFYYFYFLYLFLINKKRTKTAIKMITEESIKIIFNKILYVLFLSFSGFGLFSISPSISFG